MVKSEPAAYSWEQFEKDGHAAWTGVRNYQARNNLRAMSVGDVVHFYHSVTGKEIVGLAKVSCEAYADPTAEEAGWDCVDLAPMKRMKYPVKLETISRAGSEGHRPVETVAALRDAADRCRTCGHFENGRRIGIRTAA